jgi:hypothetical protein
VKFIAVLLAVSPFLSQAAEISGTVCDLSHAVVPGATVTATQQDTNAHRGVTTSVEGVYVLPVTATVDACDGLLCRCSASARAGGDADPDGVTSGPAVPVAITIGNAGCNTVMVAVQ